MPLFSVIIPTYNHADTIIWSIKSVQEQTFQDLEIIVVGDGVPDRTREIMAGVCADDDRVRFVDNPKGKSRGEEHRHAAVMSAKGKLIAYNADDDIWHRSHLEVLKTGLQEADFCNTLHSCVFPDGTLKIQPGSTSESVCQFVVSKLPFNFFGPSCVGHSKQAYKRLPHGWRPAPEGMWTDLHMWRQWFATKGIKFKTIPILSSLHFDSDGRSEASNAQRAEELGKWLEKIRDDEFFRQIELQALRRLAVNYGGYSALTVHYEKIITRMKREKS